MRPTPLRALAAAAVASFALLACPGPAAEAAPIPIDGTVSAVLKGTEIRFATFNVRTSRADIGTSRHWLHRAYSVAQEIKSRDPGIVAIQELGPGRADGGRPGSRTRPGRPRAWNPRCAAWRRQVPAGPDHGVRGAGDLTSTQGTRILYDTNKYRLVSNCRETTGKKNYNSSCSIELPSMRKTNRRSAAYAEFEDRKTGKNFFVVSVHLDDRHSSSPSAEGALDNLRAAQVRAAYSRVSLAGSKPILFGGDLNSWKTKSGQQCAVRRG